MHEITMFLPGPSGILASPCLEACYHRHGPIPYILMPMLKRLCSVLLIFAVTTGIAPRANASAYDAHPKLVVILVIDQFREDYLQRYRSDFKPRGLRLFLDHGAYFPDCYYGYSNLLTA